MTVPVSWYLDVLAKYNEIFKPEPPKQNVVVYKRVCYAVVFYR